MAVKLNKFEKMIRGNQVQQESYEKETINEIKCNELDYLKQRIFVNSLNHINDDELRIKCLDITTHYKLFKDNETHYAVEELLDHEKDKLDKNINELIQKECIGIISEKESIPSDLLKLIESKPIVASSLKSKLNNMLSLLSKYSNNKKDINNSIFKLLDSSYINILEAQKLSKQVDILNNNSQLLQTNIINTFSGSKNVLESLEIHYNNKEKEYFLHLEKLKNIQKLHDKYKEVDGPQYRTLIKKFIQFQEITKIKTEMYNNY